MHDPFRDREVYPLVREDDAVPRGDDVVDPDRQKNQQRGNVDAGEAILPSCLQSDSSFYFSVVSACRCQFVTQRMNPLCPCSIV